MSTAAVTTLIQHKGGRKAAPGAGDQGHEEEAEEFILGILSNPFTPDLSTPAAAFGTEPWLPRRPAF